MAGSPKSSPPGEDLCIHAAVFSADRPANPVLVLPMTRRAWLLLLGEKAGLREVVSTKTAGKVSLYLQMRELLEEDFQEALS